VNLDSHDRATNELLAIASRRNCAKKAVKPSSARRQLYTIFSNDKKGRAFAHHRPTESRTTSKEKKKNPKNEIH
jgi:hypothetical protein